MALRRRCLYAAAALPPTPCRCCCRLPLASGSSLGAIAGSTAPLPASPDVYQCLQRSWARDQGEHNRLNWRVSRPAGGRCAPPEDEHKMHEVVRHLEMLTEALCRLLLTTAAAPCCGGCVPSSTVPIASIGAVHLPPFETCSCWPVAEGLRRQPAVALKPPSAAEGSTPWCTCHPRIPVCIQPSDRGGLGFRPLVARQACPIAACRWQGAWSVRLSSSRRQKLAWQQLQPSRRSAA